MHPCRLAAGGRIGSAWFAHAPLLQLRHSGVVLRWLAHVQQRVARSRAPAAAEEKRPSRGGQHELSSAGVRGAPAVCAVSCRCFPGLWTRTRWDGRPTPTWPATATSSSARWRGRRGGWAPTPSPPVRPHPPPPARPPPPPPTHATPRCHPARPPVVRDSGVRGHGARSTFFMCCFCDRRPLRAPARIARLCQRRRDPAHGWRERRRRRRGAGGGGAGAGG